MLGKGPKWNHILLPNDLFPPPQNDSFILTLLFLSKVWYNQWSRFQKKKYLQNIRSCAGIEGCRHQY